MSEQSLIDELVRRHGRATTSFQTLGAHYRYWFDGDAYVAYVEAGGSWVVAGGPVAAEDHELEVMERFAAEARRHGKRVRFFMLERNVEGESSFATQHIGDQPVWDPATWPNGLGKKLRDQLRRARTKGIVTTRLATTEEMLDQDSDTRRGVDRVIAHWLDSRRIAELGFLLERDWFNRLEERRYFIAEAEGEVVGVMIALPVYARNGWFIDNMLRTPTAPNGTIEMMFDCMMRTFAAEGSHHVTLGLSPFAGVTSPLMRFFRNFGGWMYNFKGLHAFKAKLRPTSWHPMYIAYPRGERGPGAMMSVLTAFLRGSWKRFYWESMLHRARLSAGSWGVDLLIWLAGWLLFDTQRWFASPTHQLAWVGFDLTLAAMLVALARHWRPWLATAASALLGANAVSWMVQCVAYSAARTSYLGWIWMALGAGIPLLASRFLWETRYRYERPLTLEPQPRPQREGFAQGGREPDTIMRAAGGRSGSS